MPEETTTLERLAQEDPDVSRVALMYRDAIAAFDDPVWHIPRLSLHEASPAQSHPTLHNQLVSVDIDSTRRLMQQMATSAELAEIEPDIHRSIDSIDMPELLEILINWDAEALQEVGAQYDIEPAVVLALGCAAVIPQFHAIGNVFASQLQLESRETGNCPVCGSWPTLAEQRGLEKQLWLRCGRCGTGWKTRHQLCIFCSNTDHKTLGYLAAEGERESRRVNTCGECESYLKVFSTVTPLSHGEVLKRDLETFVLDVGATDAGFRQQPQPGFPIKVAVKPAPDTTESV
jgi:FdhE protein